MRAATIAVALTLVASAELSSRAAAKERTEVVVSYAVAPSHSLPGGLKAVAVIDAAVEANEECRDERQRKWSAMAADMVEALLFAGGQRLDPPLSVTDRRNMKLVLAEQDLRLSGLVDGATAYRVGKLLEVQGLVISRITILIDYDDSTRRAVDWKQVLTGLVRAKQDLRALREERRKSGERRIKLRREPRSGRPGVRHRRRHAEDDDSRARPGGARLAPLFGAKEIEEISRHLTVQCSFSLVDAVTGSTVVRHSPPPYRKTDKASPDFLFRRFVNEAELNPVDHFIGELVEQAAQEFVGMIVPVDKEYRYTLLGKGKAGEAGIRALRADDYEAALAHFQRAWRRDPDEHEHVFAMGVVCELLQRWQEALKHYRQAVTMEDLDADELAVYAGAKRRLAEDLDRIMPREQHAIDKRRPVAHSPAEVSE